MSRALPRRRVPALIAAALALAGAVGDPLLSQPRQRATLLVTLDITQSMDVPDMPPEAAGGEPGRAPITRLQAARGALHRLLPDLPCGTRLGWAVFTEHRSYLLLAPLEVCEHLGELRRTLAGIDNRMAWSGNSEVAKGLHSAWLLARELPEAPALVFVTDGHEAPPLSPRHRPSFGDAPGEVAGWLVGVGGTRPLPIPRHDPDGRPLGHWSADEVLQTDPRSRGRGASVEGEALVDNGPAPDGAAVPLQATPGSEHLSALREGYLQALAGERGLGYHRLRSPEALQAVLGDSRLLHTVPVRVPAAPALLGLALAALLVALWPVRIRPPNAASERPVRRLARSRPLA